MERFVEDVRGTVSLPGTGWKGSLRTYAAPYRKISKKGEEGLAGTVGAA